MTETVIRTADDAAAPAGAAPGVLRQTWIITLRDLRHWQREPATPLFGIAFTIMLVLIFGYLLGGAIQVPGGGDYLPYLLPGMFALAMMFGLEATMSAVTRDAERGITDRFRSLPMAPSAVVAGRCLANMASSAVGLAVLLAAGIAIGWRPAALVPALAAVGLLLLLRVAFLWIGIYLGLLTRDPATGRRYRFRGPCPSPAGRRRRLHAPEQPLGEEGGAGPRRRRFSVSNRWLVRSACPSSICVRSVARSRVLSHGFSM